jgi:hypothetical protein
LSQITRPSGLRYDATVRIQGRTTRSIPWRACAFDINTIHDHTERSSKVRDAFEQEINPRGIIEQMYVHDICAIVWEILRLRRCKVVQLLKQPGRYSYEHKLLRMHGSLTKRLKSNFRNTQPIQARRGCH